MKRQTEISPDCLKLKFEIFLSVVEIKRGTRCDNFCLCLKKLARKIVTLSAANELQNNIVCRNGNNSFVKYHKLSSCTPFRT
jgi:hypothetical protein